MFSNPGNALEDVTLACGALFTNKEEANFSVNTLDSAKEFGLNLANTACEGDAGSRIQGFEYRMRGVSDESRVQLDIQVRSHAR